MATAEDLRKRAKELSGQGQQINTAGQGSRFSAEQLRARAEQIRTGDYGSETESVGETIIRMASTFGHEFNRGLANYVLGAPSDLIETALNMGFYMSPEERASIPSLNYTPRGLISEYVLGDQPIDLPLGGDEQEKAFRYLGLIQSQFDEQPNESTGERLFRATARMAGGQAIPGLGFYNRARQLAGEGATALAGGAQTATRQLAGRIARYEAAKEGGVLANAAGEAVKPTWWRNPTLGFAASEAVSGTGAAIGGEILREEFKDTPYEPFAEIAGNVIGGGSPLAFKSALRGTTAAVQSSRSILSEAGIEKQVARNIKAQAYDPVAAATNIERYLEKGGNLAGEKFTSAQLSRDPGLLSLENATIAKSGELQGNYKAALAATNQTIRKQLELTLAGAGGNIEAVKSFIAGNVDRYTRALNARVALAVNIARDRIGKLPKIIDREASKSQAGITARAELEAAYKDARNQENALWNAIGDDVLIDTSDIKEVALRIKGEETIVKRNIPGVIDEMILTPKKQQQGEGIDLGDIDSETAAFAQSLTADLPAGGFKPTPWLQDGDTVGRLIEVRSEIMRQIREEMGQSGQKNRTKVKHLQELADTIMNAISSDNVWMQGKSDVDRNAIRAAQKFSRDLNDRFTRGPIGEVLQFDTKGGANVARELTLDELIGKGGTEGRLGLESTLEAIGFPDPKMATTPGGLARVNAAMQTFIMQKFYAVATDASGTILPKRAQQFMSDEYYGPLLKKFPALRDTLSDAAKAQKQMDVITATGDRLGKRARDEAVTSMFLNVDSNKVVSRILNSSNAEEIMAATVARLSKDETGQALRGFKQAFFDEFMARIQLRSLDKDGVTYVSRGKFDEELRKNSRAMSKLYSRDELNRIQTIRESAEMVERTVNNRARMTGSDTIEKANLLNAMMARIVGANIATSVGGKVGSSSIVFSNIGSELLRKVISDWPAENAQALINQAIFDPEVMRTLLTTVTPQSEPLLLKRLKSHLFVLPGQYYNNQDRQAAGAR